MTTRLGFRPRPVDVNKELSIVRDESQLDSEDAFGNKDGHGSDHKDQAHNEIKQKTEIIPVPPVTRVPTYETDYLPAHSITISYIKQPLEPRETHEHEAHEYDLDVDDCQFLHDVNHGTQDRLLPRHLERMLYELEVLNNTATKHHAQATGGPPGERSTTQPDATTEHLHKGEAVAVLARSCACQPYIRDRVFEFWKEKRKRAGKASLRRLQAPTPDSDNNPYHVFRQRAKPNKPQTRRRRETQEESLEKLRSIHDNLSQALAIAELVRDREVKKTRLTNMQVDAGQYNLLRTMRERPLEELDKRLQAANKTAGRQRAFDPISLPKPGDYLRNRHSKNPAMGPPVAAQSERARLAAQRHKRQNNLGKAESLLTLQLPGSPPPPTMPFAQQDVLMHAQWQIVAQHGSSKPNRAQHSADADELMQRMHGGALHMRIGRCGRVLLDPHEEGASGGTRANGASEERRGHAGGGENEAVNGVTSPEGQNAGLQNSLCILMDKL